MVKSIRPTANIELNGRVIDIPAFGNQADPLETKICFCIVLSTLVTSDMPSLQTCTVCLGASGRDGRANASYLNKNLMFDLLQE